VLKEERGLLLNLIKGTELPVGSFKREEKGEIVDDEREQRGKRV
jgi:hypothetical protein